jgi:hypothetical protein
MWSFTWLRIGKKRSSGKHNGANRSPRQRAGLRPRLEGLEDRFLLSGFTTPVNYPVGTAPVAVVTADLNNDGALDIITCNAGTYDSTGAYVGGGGISVLLGLKDKRGNPTGTFGPARNYDVGPSASLAVADLDGNGTKDIVTASGSVLLGNGDGTFRVGPTYAGGLSSYVTAADLNGDGKIDLITAGYGGSKISVLLGNGDGTFRAGATYAIPNYLQGVTVGDFNSDHKLDILAVSDLGGSLLPGRGDGAFGPAQSVPSIDGGLGFVAITAADFNGDGKLDFAVMSDNGFEPGSSVVAQLGNGDGTFRTGGGGSFLVNPGYGSVPPDSVIFNPIGFAAADINHDGKLDLITVGAGGPGTAVDWLPGNGDGTFGSVQQYNPPSGSFVSPATAFALGDFNGDGYTDLVMVGGGGGRFYASVLLWSQSGKH